MKKALLLFASAALILAGCAKENYSKLTGKDGVVSFTVALPETGTRAVTHQDGNAACINHWIMEVIDEDGDLYNRQVKEGTKGAKTQTFEVALVKDQSFTVLFWADSLGTYDTESLRDVKLVADDTDGYVANEDSRDAFSAVVTNFQSTAATSANEVTLKRPFGQMNVVFTDLKKLYETMGSKDAEYKKYEPKNFIVTAKIPTSFNVMTQTAGEPAAVELVNTAEFNYRNNYAAHTGSDILYMDYIFATAESKDIVDIDFSFTSKGNSISHSFTSIPFQRNYRTNILGDFMTSNAKWTVTVDPVWAGEEDIKVYTATIDNIEALNTVLASSKAEAADEVTVTTTMPTDSDTQTVNFTTANDEQVINLNFEGTLGAQKTITFANEGTAEGPANLNITAPKNTTLEFNNPMTHVVINGTEYENISGTFSASSLIIAQGVTVNNLTIDAGGLEIHGTVNAATVTGTTATVFVRACEGLSSAVYTALQPYIAEGYEGVQKGDKYDIVLKNEWPNYAAKSFSQKDETTKTITIVSAQELALFAKEYATYKTYNVELVNNIDLAGHNWVPMGDGESSYQGDFNGNSKKISNMTINADRSYVGFFADLGINGFIKNTIFESPVVVNGITRDYTGVVAGRAAGTIEVCRVKGGSVAGGEQVGGITGYAYSTTIRFCIVDGTQISGKNRVGGIVGKTQVNNQLHIVGNVVEDAVITATEKHDISGAAGVVAQMMSTTKSELEANHFEVKNNVVRDVTTTTGSDSKFVPVGEFRGTSDLVAEHADYMTNNAWYPANEPYYDMVNPSNAQQVIRVYNAAFEYKYKIGEDGYLSFAAALAAVKDGETISIAENVTDTPAEVGAIANVNGKTFTVKGAGKNLTTIKIGDGKSKGGDGYCDYRFYGANVTFEDLNFSETMGNANYQGLAYVGKLNFKNCKFEGRTTYWGDDATIEDCVFEHADSYDYCLWTWGCDAMTIKNCTFNTQGKAVKMYGAGTSVLTVTGCTFNSNGQHSGADKPAIAINTGDYTTDYTVYINNCTQNGFVAGATGSAMFGSDLASEVSGNLDVYVDGVQVWKDGQAVK